VGDHRSTIRIVATRFFWWKHKSKITAHRRLDSHAARYRSHTRYIEAPWRGVNRSRCASLRIHQTLARSRDRRVRRTPGTGTERVTYTQHGVKSFDYKQ
jgi:hypothetical protein